MVILSVATLLMLSSTLSDMELDERGHLVRLIPSLSGRIYKLKDEMVEPIALDASSLLFSSLICYHQSLLIIYTSNLELCSDNPRAQLRCQTSFSKETILTLARNQGQLVELQSLVFRVLTKLN